MSTSRELFNVVERLGVKNLDAQFFSYCKSQKVVVRWRPALFCVSAFGWLFVGMPRVKKITLRWIACVLSVWYVLLGTGAVPFVSFALEGVATSRCSLPSGSCCCGSVEMCEQRCGCFQAELAEPRSTRPTDRDPRPTRPFLSQGCSVDFPGSMSLGRWKLGPQDGCRSASYLRGADVLLSRVEWTHTRLRSRPPEAAEKIPIL